MALLHSLKGHFPMFSSPGVPAGITVLLSAAAIAPLTLLPTALPAEAAGFSQIYAFGDSLVDTGNAFTLTGVPPAPYSEGRFSNGPIWTEYLADELGITQTSFGYGGASTGEQGLLLFGGGPVAPVPGLLSQVDSFVTNAPTVDPDALYVLWAGANDYLFGGVTNPAGPVTNLASAVGSLSGAGARNFLLVNQPDLGNLPLLGLIGAPPETVAGLNALASAHNQGLASAVAGLDAAGVNAELLDANSLLRQASAGGFGFTNATDACTLTPTCVGDKAVEDTFVFWDEVHPTTRAHFVLAQAARKQLKGEEVSVPEPGVLLGLLVLSALAAHGLSKQEKGGDGVRKASQREAMQENCKAQSAKSPALKQGVA